MVKSRSPWIEKTRRTETLARRQPRPAGRWPRVLVVDDDRDMCRVVAHLLGELVVGQSLIWESDPRLARDAIRREPPDLLVTDIGMPDGGGAPLVRAVREGERASGRRAAILVITGDLTWSARREMLEAGADDLLSKPFTPADLVLAARRLLELHSGDPFG